MKNQPEVAQSYGINLRRNRRRPDNRLAWIMLGSSEIGVELCDVSPEGACVISPRPIGVGRKLAYQLGIRGSGDRFEAVCVRCAPAPGGWELGLCHQLQLCGG